MELLVVVTTVATQDEARAMARSLVEHGLAACAQISAIESFYVWQGAVEHAPEYRVLFKTVSARYGAVEHAIRAVHSYQLPAIHAYPVAHAEAAYAAWVVANSDGEAC